MGKENIDDKSDFLWNFSRSSSTVGQLISLRYFIGVLVVGFGVQVGLFSYLKNYKRRMKGSLDGI